MAEAWTTERKIAALNFCKSGAERDVEFCKFIVLSAAGEAGFVLAAAVAAHSSFAARIATFIVCALAVLSVARAVSIMIASFARADDYELKLIDLKFGNDEDGNFKNADTELNETMKGLKRIAFYFDAAILAFLVWVAIELSGY